MAETPTDQIKKILLRARKARTPAAEEEALAGVKALGRTLASDEERLTPSELAKPEVEKGAMAPADVISPYYGKQFARELIRAATYNQARPTLEKEAYAKMFDIIPAQRTAREGASYTPDNSDEGGKDEPMVRLKSARSQDISEKNFETYKGWLRGEDPELKARAEDFFKTNSIDPNRPENTQLDVIEHEFGHHATDPERNALAKKANYAGYEATGEFEEFGGHTGETAETTQALGRLQREVFKNTGNRLTNPKQFMSLVEADEVPAYLSQEGQRILTYSRNLKKVADTHKDKGRVEAAKKALKAISEMAPALVKNQPEPKSFVEAVNTRMA
jgi:hypothetical protein